MTVKTPEEKAADLAVSVAASKAQNKAAPSMKQKYAVLGIAGLMTSVILGYIWWPSDDNTGLKTSDSTAFIDGGDAFGGLSRPAPAPRQDPNPELVAKIKELEALIEELKNRPAEKEVVKDTAEIDRLSGLLEDFKRQLEQAQGAYESSLSARDLEIARLRNELDAMRLGNGETVNNGDAQRLAAEALWKKRVNSGLSPLGSSGGGDDGSKATVGNDQVDNRRISSNDAFARAAAKPAQVEQAKVIANPANTILQGTVIQASLETAINTDLPSMVRAVISEDVHSYDGQRVLIPRGSKVIGKYNDQVTLGQNRVMLMWDRIILPDNQTVTINSYGGDPIGQAGVAGRVNTHFFSRFGSATLISAIGIAPAAATAALSTRDNNGNSNNNNGYNAANTLASAISQNMNSSLGGVIGDYLKRPPTIGVHQGANITIFVDRDLEIF